MAQVNVTGLQSNTANRIKAQQNNSQGAINEGTATAQAAFDAEVSAINKLNTNMLSYPMDTAAFSQGHYVIFQIHDLTTGRLVKEEKEGGFKKRSFALKGGGKRVGTQIALYMPPSVQVQYKSKYGDAPIGATAEAALTAIQGIKIATDTIAYCPSGVIDQNKNGLVMSYLHKAIKPVNQLRMIEDAAVIYRIARAPERRMFKIDVGNLPKAKAEQYLRDVMARYRNKLVYDASTGEIRDDRNYMSMLEDFWLPSRDGGRGTDITTLPGGANLGEISDIEYFRAKLYRSLNVPVSRLEASQGFNLGRASEISRDELKFTKFVGRLRKKFTELFNDLLRTQLIIKGVISELEWPEVRDNIFYDFLQDGHFAELKNSEMMRERLNLAREVRDYIGKYYSVNYVRRNILRQTEQEIKKMDAEIKKEIDSGIISSPENQISNETIE